MIRALIIDDEPLARKDVASLLTAHDSIAVVGEADSPRTALPLIHGQSPDVLFLDIEMGRDSGFDLLRQLDSPPRVVFITAHSRHAVEAFDLPAFDYLLKPVRPERLTRTIERLEQAVNHPTAADQTVHLHVPGRDVTTRHDDILILLAEGDFTRIHFANQPPLMICQTLSHFENLLPSPPFHRLDRSTLVNRSLILSVHRKSRNSATLSLQHSTTPFPIGRTALARLTRLMQ